VRHPFLARSTTANGAAEDPAQGFELATEEQIAAANRAEREPATGREGHEKRSPGASHCFLWFTGANPQPLQDVNRLWVTYVGVEAPHVAIEEVGVIISRSTFLVIIRSTLAFWY